jgi:hypothetical protein
VHRHLRSIGHDLLFFVVFVLAVFGLLLLALVVVFATAGFPAHA